MAVDGIARRLELARADHVVAFTRGRAPEAIRALTGRPGRRRVAGAQRLLPRAAGRDRRHTAYNSRVVAAGFYQGEGAGLALGEEFHHNRVQVVRSQISGVSPRLDHRWDRDRLERTVLALQADGRLDLEPLVSHVVAMEEAVQVVLRF